MNKLSNFIIIFFAVFFGGGGFVLAIISLISPYHFKLINSWLNSSVVSQAIDIYLPPFLFITIATVMISAFLPIMFSSIDKAKKRKYLKNLGQVGTAKIISLTNTGLVVNKTNYFLKIVLEVPGGSHAEIGTFVNILSMPRVGSSIKVVYHPSNPQIVLPEWDM